MAGYKCDFVGSVHEDYYCKKCSLVAKMLTATKCCEGHFCFSCIADIKQQNKPCPECGAESYETFGLVKHQRHIAGLRVHCSLKGRGCDWSGTPEELEAHLDPDKDNCQYVDTKCPLTCLQMIQKNQVEHHLVTECAKTKYSCQVCSFRSTNIEILSEHKKECSHIKFEWDGETYCHEQKPSCLSDEDDYMFPEVGYSDHVLISPTSPACDLDNTKLDAIVKEKDKMIEEQNIKIMELENLVIQQDERLSQLDTKISEQEERLVQQEKLFKIVAQRLEDAVVEQKGSVIIPAHEEELVIIPAHEEESVRIPAHEEEIIIIPAHGEESFRIPAHGEEIVIIPPHEEEVVIISAHEEDSFRIPTHEEEHVRIPVHADQHTDSGDEIERVQQLARNLNNLENLFRPHIKVVESYMKQNRGSRVSGNKYTFEMKMFSQEKEKNKSSDWKSPAMFSHPGGYKFCIGVDANGHGSTLGKAVRVEPWPMPGEYDEQLLWPAQVEISIRLVGKDDCQVWQVNDTFVWDRPETCNHIKRWFAYQEISTAFIEHDRLGPYLHSNALHFTVTCYDRTYLLRQHWQYDI